MDDFFRGLSIGGNDIVKIVIIKFFFHIEKKNYRIIMSVLLSNDNKELMITCAANPVKSSKTEDYKDMIKILFICHGTLPTDF